MKFFNKLARSFFKRFGYEPPQKIIKTPPKTIHSEELEFVVTKTGNYYLPKHALVDGIAHAIRKNMIFDEAIYRASLPFLGENTIVLDVGSNFGQMAILYSRHVGESGLVYAFEANSFVYSILEKNIDANKVKVKPYHCAVHNEHGTTLYFPEPDFDKFGTYGSFGIDYAHSTGKPVKTVTLDSLDYPLPVSFMKVDVQGGDLFVLQGAKEIIKKFQMPIIFEYESSLEEEQNLNFQDYVDFISSINYKFHRIYNSQNYLILPRKTR